MIITDVEALLLRQPDAVDSSIADGSQDALLVRVHTDAGLVGIGEVDSMPSVVKATRRPAEEMTPIVEDLIKLLDNVGNSLRRGRYPDKSAAAKTAAVLRAVATDLEG